MTHNHWFEDTDQPGLDGICLCGAYLLEPKHTPGRGIPMNMRREQPRQSPWATFHWWADYDQRTTKVIVRERKPTPHGG